MTEPPWIACGARTDAGPTCSFRARWWLQYSGKPVPRCGTHANLYKGITGATIWPLQTEDPVKDSWAKGVGESKVPG